MSPRKFYAAQPILCCWFARQRQRKSDGEAGFKSIIVPLDGSELAESVIPMVAGVARKLDLEVVLLRTYHIPYNVYAGTTATTQ